MTFTVLGRWVEGKSGELKQYNKQREDAVDFRSSSKKQLLLSASEISFSFSHHLV